MAVGDNAAHRSVSGVRMMSTGKKVDPKDPIWGPASVNNIDAIAGLAEVIHPAFPERPQVFTEKLSLFPSGCYVFVRHEEVMKYGQTGGSPIGVVPLLPGGFTVLIQTAAFDDDLP